MIGSLSGIVEVITSSSIILQVGGVGYKVLLPQTVLSALSIGKETKVYTYTHVREDALELYGFGERQALQLFEHLIGVSGVGPKTALGIFSQGTHEGIVEAIVKGDVEFFSGIPRLGKKNAQKIIIELKSKYNSLADLDLNAVDSNENDEILSALASFGFTTKESREALKNVQKNAEAKTTEEKIKSALRHLGK